MSVLTSQGTWFTEKEECMELLGVLCESAIQGHNAKIDLSEPNAIHPEDESFKRLVVIFDKYQEQSHLLDPYLEEIVQLLMESVKSVVRMREIDRESRGSETGGAFPFQVYRNHGLDIVLKMIYILCKVRGRKSIVKLFPHEVADLEPALRLLQSQDTSDYITWESRYSLLLWLSMLVLIPFDLDTVDSGGRSASLVETISDVCKGYLSDAGATRDAAATCLARLLTRPDMENSYLEKFLDWTCDQLEQVSDREKQKQSVQSDLFLVTGVFHSLVEIFKYGHREKLIRHIPVIFERVLQVSNREGNATSLERKLTMKLVQRAGLNLLPPKVVAWRYQRGHRSLLRNLQISSGIESTAPHEEEPLEEEEDMDIPSEVEEAIEKLLCGLRDRDTIVRWSAAKGIGRVTSRLSMSLANDVVTFVLELFDASEGDSAWHGGCLALAELARRGLLLPAALDSVVPLVTQALVYDVQRGFNSVGANVRDAACYVCWAFARAYEPSVMAPHVTKLAQMMLVTALFDREVNCRRAASAAFQENVGRQGHDNFAHGIDILTKADYFTLAIRSNAYLKISAHVAQFDIYRVTLIEHLVHRKLGHWDLSLRMLTAQTLQVMTSFDPLYMANTVLSELLPRALSPDPPQRHGATLGVGHIIVALAQCMYFMSVEQLSDVRNTIMRIEKARLYRGRGGEWMRVAACELIQAIANAGHSLVHRAQIRLLETIEECMKHPKDEVKDAAVEALRCLTLNYFGHPEEGLDDGADALGKFTTEEDRQTSTVPAQSANCAMTKYAHTFFQQSMKPAAKADVSRLIDKYCASLEEPDPNPAVRRGAALALGVLPAKFVGHDATTLKRVVDILVKATKQENDVEIRDAETRRNAIISISRIIENAGFQVDSGNLFQTTTLTVQQVHDLIDAMLSACDDYEIDNRGDVGSWVRTAAIRALVRVIKYIRQFPGRVHAFRAQMENSGQFEDLLEIVDTVKFGKVHVVRRFADGKTLWVKSHKDHAEIFRKIRSSDIINSAFVRPTLDIAVGEKLDPSSVLNSLADAKGISPEIVPPALCKKVVNVIIKQLCEKMPAIRDTCAQALSDLLCDADDPAMGIPFAAPRMHELRTIFEIPVTSLNKETPKVDVECDMEEDVAQGDDEEHSSEEMNQKPQTANERLTWMASAEAYNRIAQVLTMPDYIDCALGGLIVSVGALTESVSKNASQALLTWCKEQKAAGNFQNVERLADSLLRIFDTNQKVDRVIVPTMKSVVLILESQAFLFNQFPTLEWLLKLHDSVKFEIRKCTNVSKLASASRIFFLLANFAGPIRTAALGSVMTLLGYPYPSVRMTTARDFSVWGLAMDGNQACGLDTIQAAPAQKDTNKEESMADFVRSQNALYDEALLEGRSDVVRTSKDGDFDAEDAFERVLDIIGDTRWDAVTTAEAREQRDQLFGLLLLPKVASGTGDRVRAAPKRAVAQEEEDTYATLVKNTEMGYR